MSVRVDPRPPDERMEDIVRTAEFEQRTGIIVRRCECGASMMVSDVAGLRCAGCGVPTSLVDRIEFHPGMGLPGDGAREGTASRERSAPPETSAATFPARKDADAPEQWCTRFSGRGSGSGVLGRVGKALRSLRFLSSWSGPLAGWRN